MDTISGSVSGANAPRGMLASLALGVLAGLAVILTFPPWPLPALAMVVAPLLLFQAVDGAPFRRVIAVGAIFSLVLGILGFQWIPSAITTFYSVYFSGAEASTTTAFFLGWLAFILWAVAEAIPWMIWCIALSRPLACPWLAGLWGGGIFAIFQWLWPRIFPWSWGASIARDGDTWGGIQFLGVEGCTTVVVIGSLWLSALLKREKWRRSRVILALAGLSLVSAPWWIPQSSPGGETQTMTIGVVQAGVSLERRHSRELSVRLGVLREVEEAIGQLNREGPVDLIVISEGMLPFIWSDTDVGRWADGLNSAPILIGGMGERAGGKMSNRAFCHQGQNTPSISTYDKRHLLAFGERIPLRKLLEFLGVPLPGQDLTPGEAPGIFEIAGVKIGVSICYEGILPGIADELREAGAVIHVNITEDLWYGEFAEPHQHMLLAQGRAIESGVPLLRVTNGGLSAWVDPQQGTFEVIGEVGEATIERVSVEVPVAISGGGIRWFAGTVLPLLALISVLFRLLRPLVRVKKSS